MTDWTEQFYGNQCRLIYGINVIDGLRMLADQSVQCIITSPPYWGLRNYNTEPQLWGGNMGCNHQWQTTDPRRKRSANDVPGLTADNVHIQTADDGAALTIWQRSARAAPVWPYSMLFLGLRDE